MILPYITVHFSQTCDVRNKHSVYRVDFFKDNYILNKGKCGIVRKVVGLPSVLYNHGFTVVDCTLIFVVHVVIELRLYCLVLLQQNLNECLGFVKMVDKKAAFEVQLTKRLQKKQKLNSWQLNLLKSFQ